MKDLIIKEFGNDVFATDTLASLLTDDIEFVFVSPGFDTRSLDLDTLQNSGVIVKGDIEIFADQADAKLIAVTGSNGKSTVVDLLEKVIRGLGFKTIAAGNIGIPVLDLLNHPKADFYILELSSFQLDLIDRLSVDVAVLLNISPDHIDRHGSYENYVKAKHKIYQFGSRVVYNSDENITYPKLNKQYAISFGEYGDIQYKTEKRISQVVYGNDTIISESETTLKGKHNFYNFAATIAVLVALDIEISTQVKRTLATYAGLEHRCRQIASDDNVIWIDDSKSTNTGSAIAAITSYRNLTKNLYLIAGGDAKGADLSDLILCIKENVNHTWLVGKDASRFDKLPSAKVTKSNTLESAVKSIKAIVQSGDVVLLSPGCASTDQYNNYQDRGRHFAELLKEAC